MWWHRRAAVLSPWKATRHPPAGCLPSHIRLSQQHRGRKGPLEVTSVQPPPRAASPQQSHSRACLEPGSPGPSQRFLRPSTASQGHQSCPVPPAQHTRCSVRDHLLPQAQNKARGTGSTMVMENISEEVRAELQLSACCNHTNIPGGGRRDLGGL